MKIEYIIWTLRGLANQIFPIAITFYLSQTNNTAEIGYLAPVFIACGIANLLRSGAVTATLNGKSKRPSLSLEVLYTFLSTIPFLLITPAPSQDILLINCAIVILSGISGAFAARLDQIKGLQIVGLSDITSLILAVAVSIIFIDFSVQGMAYALAIREFTYLLLLVMRSGEVQSAFHTKISLYAFAKENLGQTIFWISGPWKDYLIAKFAISLYTINDYGTYYSVQLYWTLPSLFLGLILRPVLKSYQNGNLTHRSIRKHIFWLMLFSISGLAIVQWLVPMTPPSPNFLVVAAILPAATSPFVVPAMMNAVKENKSKDIVIQNLLWAATGCATLFLMRNEGLTGLATTIVMTNLASSYIIFKHPCSTSSI
jgi:hypothetical protein